MFCINFPKNLFSQIQNFWHIAWPNNLLIVHASRSFCITSQRKKTNMQNQEANKKFLNSTFNTDTRSSTKKQSVKASKAL